MQEHLTFYIHNIYTKGIVRKNMSHGRIMYTLFHE